jgi:hypothetical protein
MVSADGQALNMYLYLNFKYHFSSFTQLFVKKNFLSVFFLPIRSSLHNKHIHAFMNSAHSSRSIIVITSRNAIILLCTWPGR